MATAYDYIARNKRKSIILLALFPVSFAVFAYLIVLLGNILFWMLRYYSAHNILSFESIWDQAFLSAHAMCQWAMPLAIGLAVFWAWQAWKQGDQIILESIPQVHRLDKHSAYDACTLLENLCIASGDFLPQLYVLEDESMNAFAVGMNPMRGSIIVSSGLLKQLDRPQLEAILAHELAHIRHYDTRLMVIIVTCVAFFTFAGEMLFFGQERNTLDDKLYVATEPLVRVRNPLFMYIGGMLLVYGYLLAPLLRFALSRARESLADAQAVLQTRYPRGLAKALWHMSSDSRIEVLDAHPLVGAMCILRPSGQPSFFERFSGIYSAHPPLEKRLHDLYDMDGLFLHHHT